MDMKAVLTDDSSVDCAGFKALDAGVVLFADERRRDALGFLPTERLRYVLPASEVATTPDGDPATTPEATAESEPDEETEAAEETEATEEAAAESGTGEQADEGRQLTALATDGTEIPCRGFKALDAGVVLFADVERTDVAGFLPREHLEHVLAEEVLATTDAKATGDERFVDAETLVGEDDADGAEAPAETGTFEQVDVDEDVRSADPDESETVEGEAETAETDESETVEGEAETAETDESETVEGEAETAETDDAAESTEAVEVVDLAEEEELTRLAGLGETYAERLRAHGIASVSDLRTTSVAELADAADVPTGQAERWKSQVE
jgi:predicted flap endonuclease-1-like 5' DNA nuclease